MAERIFFECDCGQKIAARSERAGEEFHCPRCGKIRQIPDAFDDFIEGVLEEPADSVDRDLIGIEKEWETESRRRELRLEAERAAARRRGFIALGIAVALALISALIYLLWDVLPMLIVGLAGLAVVLLPILMIACVFVAKEFEGFRIVGGIAFVIGDLGLVVSLAASGADSWFAMVSSILLAGLGALLYVAAAAAAEIQRIRRELED